MSERRRRHTPEQIIRKLREGEKQLGAGAELPAVLKLTGSQDVAVPMDRYASMRPSGRPRGDARRNGRAP